jgi:WYL domain
MFSMKAVVALRRPRRRAPLPPGPELPPERLQRRAERLAEAVRERRTLEIRYGGAWRVVHPHALGRTGTGRLGLLTWQTAGIARGPGYEGEGWRLFDVARIEDAQFLHATFTPRPRKPRKGWTAGIAAPAAEVPSREEALAAAAA